MSGIGFVPGLKRPGSTSTQPLLKKPATVGDLFGKDSDDEEEVPVVNKKSVASTVPVITSVLDVETQKVADKLADFVAKNGRNFEDMTRERNPGNTPFKFLHDTSSVAYKYYLAKVIELEVKVGKGGSSQAVVSHQQAVTSETRPISSRVSRFSQDAETVVAKAAIAAGDSLAAMDAYMKLAAKKEESKSGEEGGLGAEPLLNSNAFERRKVAAVYKEDGSRGHHMQDFIPPEELAKFLSTCGNKTYEQAAKALEERFAIKGDNIGHKLLQKMGWKEGQGIGASAQGITVPIQAGSMRLDNLGLGAAETSTISAEDDAFEQYRKRMMLGYKYRPNPLGNPRKAYY